MNLQPEGLTRARDWTAGLVEASYAGGLNAACRPLTISVNFRATLKATEAR
jgi:hypothetical protein